MKRCLFAILAFLLMTGVAQARTWNEITVIKCIDAVTIAASGNSASTQIPLNGKADLGYFSIQVQVTGDGTAKFEYQLSNNDTDYIEPASAIITGLLTHFSTAAQSFLVRAMSGSQ